MLQNSASANEEAYIAEITTNENKAVELQKKSILDLDQKIKEILIDAEQQAKEIENKSLEKQKKAVNDILDMIFSRSEKK